MVARVVWIGVEQEPRLELLQSNGVSRERAKLVALVRDGRLRYTVRLRLTNTVNTTKNYFAENVFAETVGVSEASPGLNVAGTGDRANVTF